MDRHSVKIPRVVKSRKKLRWYVPFYSCWINLINTIWIQENTNSSDVLPVGEESAIGVVAEEIAAQPVNIIGDEAIGEPVVEQVCICL